MILIFIVVYSDNLGHDDDDDLLVAVFQQVKVSVLCLTDI